MALRIPKNIIVKSKYTQGKEYMFIDTNIEYQGYYYEMNNRIFVGKEFNANASEIQKITLININPFLTKPSTFVYGIISGIKLKNTTPISQNYIPTPDDFDRGYSLRYFAKKLNQTSFIIKEINEINFNELKSNSIYQVISIKWNISGNNTLPITLAEQQMSGIKIFLETQ